MHSLRILNNTQSIISLHTLYFTNMQDNARLKSRVKRDVYPLYTPSPSSLRSMTRQALLDVSEKRYCRIGHSLRLTIYITQDSLKQLKGRQEGAHALKDSDLDILRDVQKKKRVKLIETTSLSYCSEAGACNNRIHFKYKFKVYASTNPSRRWKAYPETCWESYSSAKIWPSTIHKYFESRSGPKSLSATLRIDKKCSTQDSAPLDTRKLFGELLIFLVLVPNLRHQQRKDYSLGLIAIAFSFKTKHSIAG